MGLAHIKKRPYEGAFVLLKTISLFFGWGHLLFDEHDMRAFFPSFRIFRPWVIFLFLKLVFRTC